MKLNRASRRRVALAIASAAMLAVPFELRANADSWKDVGSGTFDFNTASNWVDASTPTASDSATFNVARTYTVNFGTSPVTNQSLVVLAGTLTFAASGTTADYNLTGAGGSQEVKVTRGSLTLGTLGHAMRLMANQGLSVQNYGSLNVNYGSVTANTLYIGTETGFSTGSVTVDGGALTINGTGDHWIGLYAATGNLTLKNWATGSIAGTLHLADSYPFLGTANVTVQSGSNLTLGNVLAANRSAGTAAILVSGAKSRITQSGASTLTLGSASGGSATLSVDAEGVYTGGTGLITINKTASVKIGSASGRGEFNANGDVTINGGTVTVTNGAFNPAADKPSTLNIQGGGKLLVTGGDGFNLMFGPTMSISGTGSQFSSNGAVYLMDARVNISGGGSLASDYLQIGNTENGPGAVVVDGGTSSLTANSTNIGHNWSTGTLTFQNGATGSLGMTNVVAGPYATGKSALVVQSGAMVTAGSLIIGNQFYYSEEATLTVAGVGSKLTQSGNSTLVLGANYSTRGRIDLTGSGVLEGGTGLATINTTGSFNIDGGRYKANGDILINGGRLNWISGYFDWAEGKGLTIQSGGEFDIRHNSAYTLPANAVINVKEFSVFATGTGRFTIGPTNTITVDRGVLYAGGDMVINGGTLNVNNGQFDRPSGQPFTLGIQSGGRLLITDRSFALNDGHILNISGAGSQLSGNRAVALYDGQVNVSQGGSLASDSLEVGYYGLPGAVVVDGVASSLTTNTTKIGESAIGTLTFQNAASGGLGATTVAMGTQANSKGTLLVQSGATVSTGELKVGNLAVDGHEGTLTVTGAGSKLTQSEGAGLFIGAGSKSTGAMNITDGGAFQQGSSGINTFVPARIGNGSTTLNPTGSITVKDATVVLGSLVANGSRIRFDSGSLGFGGDLTLGPSGPMGSNLVLTSNHSLAISGVARINAGSDLRIEGGSFSAGSLDVRGSFQFLRGTLALTGSNGLNIGSGGPLGSNLLLASGRTLVVGGMSTVAPEGLLVIEDGTVNAAGGITNQGEIRLSHAMARLSGGAFYNQGVIVGDGRITNSMLNMSSGQVRVSAAERLVFTGNSNTNEGRIQLFGGTAEFSVGLANWASGIIAGRGTLITQTGLSNSGQIQLSGGFTDVLGNLSNAAGSKVIVSGGATATFYNDVTNAAGSEFRVSAGSTAVFFGNVQGTSVFTGAGTKVFEGGISTLNLMQTAGSTIVEAAASLSMAAIQEQELTVNGTVQLTGEGPASRLARLNIAGATDDWSGSLDMTDHDLIVQSNTADRMADLARISNQIQSARNGGAGLWGGRGITTSAAGQDGLKTLAVILNDRGTGRPIFGQFRDEAVDENSILLAYGWTGDTDLNGLIDASDYFRLARGLAKGLSGYQHGDLDYSGGVDLEDFGLIDRAFLAQQSGRISLRTAAVVPEPGSVLWLLGGVLMLDRRRRI